MAASPSLDFDTYLRQFILLTHNSPFWRIYEPKDSELLFLPPYSPDFTPIEQAFSKIKAILRGLGARIRDALVEAIRLAVDAITCDDAVAWFTHAGYSLPAESS